MAASTISAHDTFYECSLAHAGPDGTFSPGQRVRGDHPALTSAPGYFVPAGTPHDEWPSPYDRAIELAARLRKSPIHIALAYVLNQPFPSVPLIGPRTLGELDDSLRALDIALSPADLEWLDGGSLHAA